jgi:hypothetical protein
MRSLGNCPLFQIYSKSGSGEQVKSTMKMFKSQSEFLVDLKQLDIQLLSIGKYKFPLKDLVLDALAKRKVILTYSEKPSYLPMASTFPFLLMVGENDRPVSYVHLTPLASKLEKLTAQRIYGLIEAALISLTMTNATKWRGLQNSEVFLTSGAQLFADMTFRLLDTRHAIGLKNEDTDKTLYILGRYYLSAIMQLTTQSTIQDIAYRLRRFSTPRAEMDTIDQFIEPEKMNSFQTGIESLKLGLPSLSSANYYNVIADWTKRYGESTLFAVEYLPYFIYMIIATERKTNLVNTKAVVNSVNTKPYYEFIKQLERATREVYNDL